MATETIITKESPEIEAYKLGLLEQAKNLVDAPPTGGLPAIQQAGLDPLQTQAAGLATQGVGSFQPFLNQAAATQQAGLAQFGAGQSALTDAASQFGAGTGAPTQAQMSAYMNPYQQAVQDEINRSFDLQAAQAGLTAAGAGAFGGSRGAIQQSEIGRNRAAALAKAQADNFLQAQAAAQNELGRALQAGQGLTQVGQVAGALGKGIGSLGLEQASLGELGQSLNLQDINVLSQLGQIGQAQSQAELEADRQTQMQNIYEPYQRLGFYGDILAGAPTSQQQISQSASPDPSLLNQIVGGATSALGLYGAGKGTGLI